MRSKSILFIILILCSFARLDAQLSIENRFYLVTALGKSGFQLLEKKSGLRRQMKAELDLIYHQNRVDLVPSNMDGQPGIMAWQRGSTNFSNIKSLGSTSMVAKSVALKSGMLVFDFSTDKGQVYLTVGFLKDQEAPVIEMGLEASQEGSYSLGFTGMPEVDSADLDFLYQPLTWSWKRFPSKFALTEEAYANTAAVFDSHHGITEGLAVLPSDIPYRYAYAAQWNNAGKPEKGLWAEFPASGPRANSLFGLAIRNPAGKAQPLIYSPVPGTSSGYLQKGEKRKLRLVVFAKKTDWQAGSSWLLASVFKYRNERENATASLNETFDNMLDFAMNDQFSGWNEELKASNYQFDVPGSVKNVSALHPLSLAMVTGDEDVLKRRAIPMMEYVMSREKFLFSTNDSPHQAQVPSFRLNGPCVDIGELSALDALTHGSSPAFANEAKRLFGKSRQLNMNTETGGGSWQDYLARYRLAKDPADLAQAAKGAREYLSQVYFNYSHNFFDSPGLRDKGAGFTTDYGFRIYDLIEIFEETRDSLFLKAAETGARQFMLWTRSTPQPPVGNTTVNKGGLVKGIFPGRRVSAIEGSGFQPMDQTTAVPQQVIPAWRTSLNGLIPEAPNTYAFGPVMLAHHAPWMLRLAAYSRDTLFRNAAYNAVLGRYANFPGYYFTSLETDIYQRKDYPLHPYLDVKYNAIFYNHVWPHLALLMDFIVSDFYYRSGGAINFPGTYAPGYAFLTSQVYGGKSGRFMGVDSVKLWMPRHAIRSTGVLLNHVMGYNAHDLFIAFANTSSRKISESIQLDPDVIPYTAGKTYQVLMKTLKGQQTIGSMRDGKLNLSVEANGLLALQIKGLGISEEPVPAKTDRRNRFFRSDSLSQTPHTAMILEPVPGEAVFYIYTSRTWKQWQSATLRYRLGADTAWKVLADGSYPYEFEVKLPTSNTSIEYVLTGVDVNGLVISSEPMKMNTGPVTILGLGDSITEGGPQFVSYLFSLDSMIKARDLPAVLIGPRTSARNGRTVQHAGFSGKTAEFLAKQIDSIYMAYPADIVLLHSGHNHFVEEEPIESIIRAQKGIIQTILATNPQAHVLVAAVITSGKLPKYEYIPSLNKRIKEMVDSFNDEHVQFVDQSEGWNWQTDAISDMVHPNAGGALKIARHWYTSLSDLMKRE